MRVAMLQFMDYKGFAARMREARIRAGVSQETLANKLGGTSAWLNRLENGHTPLPRVDMVANIAEILGTTAAYLLGFEIGDDADFLSVIEEFIASEPRVTPEQAEHLRVHRWSAPGGVTVGLVREAWLNMALTHKGVVDRSQSATDDIKPRPGRVPLKPAEKKKR